MDRNRSSDEPEGGRTAELVVKDNTVEDRFELFVDDMPAGFVAYEMQGQNYVLTHTEIDPDFEGRGMGSALTSRTLEMIRAQGRTVVPVCPFVQSFLQGHPQYLDLVSARDRQRYNLPAA
jgi:predicted GNAT family acetyltransferase